jgi:hypothetical protein
MFTSILYILNTNELDSKILIMFLLLVLLINIDFKMRIYDISIDKTIIKPL